MSTELPRRQRATGTRMPHMAIARMSTGAITAPVERTTPASTKVTPKKRKEPMAMWLRWRATSSEGLPPGRNQPSTWRSSSTMRTIRLPVIKRLPSMPALAVALTRLQSPAPTFCAAMDEQAAPMAMAGICT